MKVGELETILRQFHPNAEIVMVQPGFADRYQSIRLTLEGVIARDGISHLYVEEDGTVDDMSEFMHISQTGTGPTKVRIVKLEMERYQR